MTWRDVEDTSRPTRGSSKAGTCRRAAIARIKRSAPWVARAASGTRFALCASLVVLFGCTPPSQPMPRFVLGQPYQAGGVWHYPTERYDLDETGIAGILPDREAKLTSDGEVFDHTAMAAAHPTLQLPSVARISNLETGRAVIVRVTDRGSGAPQRLVEVTRRVAELLGIPPRGVARVRLEVLPIESHAAADSLRGASRLAVTPAPREGVQTTALPPPPGIRAGAGRVARAGPAPLAESQPAAPGAPPMSLPERVERIPVSPGNLWVRLDTFQEYRYAVTQRAKLAGLKPTIVPLRDGRTRSFRVQIGPIASVGQADAVLSQALAAGIPDARIVVE